MPNTIADNLARLQAARTAIANAIIAAGGDVDADDGYEEFPNDIATIPTYDVYGVEWTTKASGNNTSLKRVGKSAGFTEPVPYFSGMTDTPSSPFDALSPWKDMTVSTIDGNSVVSIPKFYYKITKNATTNKLRILISSSAVPGFHVSPAHRDRGDGEKSVVYVGRYHSDSNYKSTSGSIPISSITRAQARAGSHNLGSDYWMLDFSMWVTIWLLYLVEFANWDSQTVIGYGCGNGSSKENTGSTDSMPYHTGTMQTSRTTYGVGVQYRWIEDPWGNVADWCDGITFNQSDVYCFENLADYSDSYQSTGATLVGTRPTSGNYNYIQDLGVSAETGYEWFLYPFSVGSSQANIPDCCYSYYYDSSGVVLRVGGSYYQDTGNGLFCLVGRDAASYQSASSGARLMVI